MGREITYRSATLWDIPSITAMWALMMDEIKLPYRVATPLSIEKFFVLLSMAYKKGNRYCLVAVDDKTPIGFVSGKIFNVDFGTEDLVGACDNLYVEKDYRKGDIAKQLTRYAYDIMVKMGAKQIEFVTPYSPKLIKRYTRTGPLAHMGFKPAEIIFRKEVSNG